MNGEIFITQENLDSNYILNKVQHVNTEDNKIKLGFLAGFNNQGNDAIAIGRYAGYNFQASNSIVINATGAPLENTTPNSLKCDPIRQDIGNFPFLNYNTLTKEITYQDVNYLSRPYGAFINTNSINIPQNTPTLLTYNLTPESNNISFDVVNPSRIKFNSASTYKIGCSILFNEVGGSGAEVYFSFLKSGILIPNSASECFVNGNNKRTLAYAELIVTISNPITEYIEIIAYTNDTGISAIALPSPNALIGESPSIITTCYKIN